MNSLSLALKFMDLNVKKQVQSASGEWCARYNKVPGTLATRACFFHLCSRDVRAKERLLTVLLSNNNVLIKNKRMNWS